jgi:hypothetical protein
MYRHVYGRIHRNHAVAVLGVAVLLALVLTNLPITQGGGAAPTGAAPIPAALTAKPATPPGALHIPLAGPVVNLVKGDRVNLTYEYEAVSYNSSVYSLSLRMPTIFGVFTQKDRALLYVALTVRNVTLPHSQLSHGWFNNGSTTHVSDIITNNVTLNTKVEPFLSSVKLSMMANTSWGNVRIGIRWEYTVWIEANNTTLSSGWSTVGGNQVGIQQSVVTPAQLIAVANTTPEHTTVGSWFRATLTGLVSPADYWIEIESPFSGQGVYHLWDNSTAVGLTNYTVSILLERFSGIMTPTPWLVHIHDGHGDILYSLSVYLTDPTNASLYFKTSPSTCGPIDFNRISETNGGHALNVTANRSYSLAAGSCAGYTFAGWSQFGGGAQIANPNSATTTVDLLYNDTVTALYVPSFLPPL